MTDITPERVRALLEGTLLSSTVTFETRDILIDGKSILEFTLDLARAYLDMAARVEGLNGELSRLRRIDRKLSERGDDQ